MRNRITLECTECKNRNYDTFKNKKNDPDRLTFSKYCPTCKKHTAHKDSKQQEKTISKNKNKPTNENLEMENSYKKERKRVRKTAEKLSFV